MAEARRWLGTPYHHQASVMGPHGGVDCAMIVLRVFQAVGIVPWYNEDFTLLDPRPYPPDWHLHRDDERYLGWVEHYGSKIDGASAPGDVALFREGRGMAHGAIVTGPDKMIHADVKAGLVVESEIFSSPRYAKRLAGFWRVRGLSIEMAR